MKKTYSKNNAYAYAVIANMEKEEAKRLARKARRLARKAK